MNYSACETFTKNKEKIHKFKEKGGSWYIYQNELDKTCFQHDIASGDFKDLPRRTTSDKILCDKVFNNAENVMVIKEVVVLKMKLQKIENSLRNCTNQSLQNLRNENYNYLLKTIFVVLI